MTFNLDGFDLDAFVRNTLAEDLGVGLSGGGRDVQSSTTVDAACSATARRPCTTLHYTYHASKAQLATLDREMIL